MGKLISLKDKGNKFMELVRPRDVKKIASWFVINNNNIEANSLEGHLKIQKLLYYAQAMHLTVFGVPLFNQKIEAWKKGPVVREVYREYKHNSLAVIALSEKCTDKNVVKPVSDIQEHLLNVVNSVYGNKTADELVELTHSEKPWQELKEQAERRENPEIKQEKMQLFYKSLKDIYDVYSQYEFDNEITECINGNNFTYNINNMKLTDAVRSELEKIGHTHCNKTFYIEDYDGELVIY